MIKAIIFDFFDVIRSDQAKAWLQAHPFVSIDKFHEASEKLNIGEITPEQFLQKLGKLSGEKLLLEEFEKDARVNYEVIDIIKTVKKNYRVSILSNAPSAFLRDLIQKYNITEYVDEVIISSEVGYSKPSVEIFKITLKRLKVLASETIFIDDNLHNVKGAEKIGIIGIHFISTKQLKQDLKKIGIFVLLIFLLPHFAYY